MSSKEWPHALGVMTYVLMQIKHNWQVTKWYLLTVVLAPKSKAYEYILKNRMKDSIEHKIGKTIQWNEVSLCTENSMILNRSSDSVIKLPISFWFLELFLWIHIIVANSNPRTGKFSLRQLELSNWMANWRAPVLSTVFKVKTWLQVCWPSKMGQFLSHGVVVIIMLSLFLSYF